MAVAHNFAEKARTNDVMTSESVDFAGLLLSKPVLNGLKNAGFERPSPIQLKAIPLGRCGLDLIVQAKSGTGKTCVFSVVALEGIETTARSTQVLVLAPTREIALQIWEVINSIGSAMSGLQCHTFIGGLPVHEDRNKLQLCHIAVGTPGRIQSLIDQGILKTDNIRLFILDEADKLLEESFQKQINWIYSALPDNKQMVALSATYPEYLAEHLTLYMRNPTFVRLNITDPALLGIKQYYTTVACHPLPNKAFDLKTAAVIQLLSSVSFHQCLIFSNLQTRAQNLESELNSEGWPTTCIAGCLDQKNRIQAMHQLKSYKCRILISTDLTSRGIDADRVNLVINLDVPKDHETYLHRIGRAGRFGSYGAGVSIVSEGQEMIDLQTLEHRISTCIQPLPDPIPSDLVKRQLQVNLDDVVSTEQLITRPDTLTWPHSPSSHSLHPPNTQPGLVQPHNGLPSTEETALNQGFLCQPTGSEAEHRLCGQHRANTTKSCDLTSPSPGQASENSVSMQQDAKTSNMPGLSPRCVGVVMGHRDSVQRGQVSETASLETTKLLADAGLSLDVEQDAGHWFVERGGRQSGKSCFVASVRDNRDDTKSLACAENGGSLTTSQAELTSSQLLSGEQGGAGELPGALRTHVSQGCVRDGSRLLERESAVSDRNNIPDVGSDGLINGNKGVCYADRNLKVKDKGRRERLDDSGVDNRDNNGVTIRETESDDRTQSGTLTDTCTGNTPSVQTELSAAGDANRKLPEDCLASLSNVSGGTKGSRDTVSEADTSNSADSKNGSNETDAPNSASIRNKTDSKTVFSETNTRHSAGKTGASTETEKVSVKRRGRGKASADLWSSLLCGEQAQDTTSSPPEPPTPSPHSAPHSKSHTSHKSPQSDKQLSWESELALYKAARSKVRQVEGEGEEVGSVKWDKTESSRPVSKARRRLGKTGEQKASCPDLNTQLSDNVPNGTAINMSPQYGAATTKLFSFTQPTTTKTVTVNGEEPAVHYAQSKSITATTVSDACKVASCQKADRKKPVGTSNGGSSDVLSDTHTPHSAPQPTVQCFSEKRVCPGPINQTYQGRCSRPVRGVTYSAALQDYEEFISQTDNPPVLTSQHIVAKTFTVPPTLDKTQCAQLENFLLHFHTQMTDRRPASLTDKVLSASHTATQQSHSLAREADVTPDKSPEVIPVEGNHQHVKDGPALPTGPQPSPDTGTDIASKTKEAHVSPVKSLQVTHTTDDHQNNNVDEPALPTNTDTDTDRKDRISEKMVNKEGPPGKIGNLSGKSQDKAGRPRRYRPMAVCGPATQHMFHFTGEGQGTSQAVDVAEDSAVHTQTASMTQASLSSPLTHFSNTHRSQLTGDTVNDIQAMLSQHTNTHTPQSSGTFWDKSGGKGAIPIQYTTHSLKTDRLTCEPGREGGDVSQQACTSDRQQGSIQKPAQGLGAYSRLAGAASLRQQAGNTRSKQTLSDAANPRRTQNNTNARQTLKKSANSRQPHGSTDTSEDSDSEDSDDDSSDQTSSSEGEAKDRQTGHRESSVCIENHYAVEGGGRGRSRKLRSMTHRREHGDRLVSDSSSLNDTSHTRHSEQDLRQRFHPTRSDYYAASKKQDFKHRPDPARSDYYAFSHDHAWSSYTGQALEPSQRESESATDLRSSKLRSGFRHAHDEPSAHSAPDYGHHWEDSQSAWRDGCGSHPQSMAYQFASAHNQSQHDYSPYQASVSQEPACPWYNPYPSPWSNPYTYPPSQTAQQPGSYSYPTSWPQHNQYSVQASQHPNPYYQSAQASQQPSPYSYHPATQLNLYSYPPNQHSSSYPYQPPTNSGQRWGMWGSAASPQQYLHSAWSPQYSGSMKTGMPSTPSYIQSLSQVQAARAHSLLQYTRKMARFYARVCDHAT